MENIPTNLSKEDVEFLDYTIHALMIYMLSYPKHIIVSFKFWVSPIDLF